MIQMELGDLERSTHAAVVRVQPLMIQKSYPVELDEIATTEVDQATARYAASMQEQLNLAVKYGEEWCQEISDPIMRNTARGRQ